MALDLDKLKDKKARRQTSGWSAKEGANIIRILPHTSAYFTDQVGDFAFEFRSHFLKVEGADTQVVRCLRDKKEVCPFCNAVSKHRESTNPKTKKTAEETKASERHLLNIVDLNDIPSGIQAYECGPMVYNGVLDFMANPAWGDLVSPTTGRNITLQLTPGAKSSSGFNSYAVMPYPQQTDISPHLPADWKEKLDGLSASIPAYPEAAEIVRWLNVLGLADATAPQPTPPPASAPVAPATPAPITTSSPPVPVATVSTAAPTVIATSSPGDPITAFAQANNLGVKNSGEKLVPACFSEGPNNKEVGFNPSKFPCEKGCPVRADCQLKSLGLA